MKTNRQVVLKRHPAGIPVAEDFALVEAPLPVLEDGQFLIRNRFFSMEPAIRGWLDGKANYFAPIALGQVIRAPSMGVVIESRHPDFKPGELVRGLNNWEEYSVLSDSTILLEKVHPSAGVPLSWYVGALGPSGHTAYVGLHQIGRLRAGETVVISAAVGAVGSVAGQIAKRRGCRVIGLVGSDDKARIATEELGFHAAINYRKVDDLAAAVRNACPDGVDIYFDNVGGATLDAMLTTMNVHGRIIGCGMISGYNQQDNPPPIYNLWEIVSRQLEFKGFLLFSYADDIPAAVAQLEDWVRQGDFKVLEYKRSGLEQAAPLFCALMSGQTVGKAVLELPA
jgi:NADPH-dependent curcumin reductase CurA